MKVVSFVAQLAHVICVDPIRRYGLRRWLRRVARRLEIAALALVPTAAMAQPTLCSDAEEILFSCALEGSGKIVSLCGAGLPSPDGYLQYRFGRTGAVELVYPEQQQSSISRFTFSSYSRTEVARSYMSFKNGAYEYLIYYRYEGESGVPEIHAGVAVSGPKQADFVCLKPIIEKLGTRGVIPCGPSPELPDVPCAPYLR